jgi:hypothetical protein
MADTTSPTTEKPHPDSKGIITVRCKSESELDAIMMAAGDNGVMAYVNFQRDQGFIFMQVSRKHARKVAGVVRRAGLPYAKLLEAEHLGEQ